eukprot:maker-scaffold431_size173393-snap-gene-0.28 protein:Tk07313 transcript:maker-scaffold431_size173393-snap-gene-0.28-mRNA-1 annotation:"hypothetical protein DAPPUDRAFT_59074"
MDAFARVLGLLCLYGFLKELRPSEPFLTEYLINPNWTNITLEEAYYDVYPLWTYSYLAVLILVFLLTDLLRYKPVIVIEGFAYIGTWCLLLWGKGVRSMQLMQFCYGVATSTEVAYYTYIYAKVEPRHFQKVTSWTRVALLVGRFLSGCLAQILTSSGILDYKGLNYFSLGSVSLATLVSFALPGVDRTIYFHAQEGDLHRIGDSDPNPETSTGGAWIQALRKVRADFLTSFGNPYILKWSIWWALGMCGNFQVGNYIQPLWETISPVQETAHIYNGAVEAVTTLAGAFLAFILGYVKLNWALVGEPVLFFLSVADGVILVVMANASDIWVAYVGYFLFRACYQMLITVASYEIASRIKDDSYGLIFGFNTFLALLFQTVLTVVVADDVGLALPPRIQFVVYGGFWLMIGSIFLLIFLQSLWRQGWDGFKARMQTEGIWTDRHGFSEGGERREYLPTGALIGSEKVMKGKARLAKPFLNTSTLVWPWTSLYSSKLTSPATNEVVVAMAGMIRPAISLDLSLSAGAMP